MLFFIGGGLFGGHIGYLIFLDYYFSILNTTDSMKDQQEEALVVKFHDQERAERCHSSLYLEGII